MLLHVREVFNWVSKVIIVNCFGFALLHPVIGSKFSRHFFNQSQVKPKPIVARACTFSRALCRLRIITSSFDWFTGLSPSCLIGQSNYLGFVFTTLDWNSLYSVLAKWHYILSLFMVLCWFVGFKSKALRCIYSIREPRFYHVTQIVFC